MSKPDCFEIGINNGRMYYNSKELLEYNPEFYYGCKAKPRLIIQRKTIPDSDYLYATLKSNEWKLSTKDCKKAQLLISKEWVDTHYFKPIDNTQKTEDKEELIEKAPPVLHLTDDEKFKDCDGNIIEIETRGEKHRNKLYFKTKDVSTAFGLPNLKDVLLHKEKGYERNIDYKILFIRCRPTNGHPETIKKCLYLTYHGLLRVLFVSRNKQVRQFQDWAEDKLFTIQMGTNEEKVKLGTDILNISVKTYKAVFDTYASKFPCIYLLSLGKVKDIRETFRIDSTVPDDSVVYKFGFTDDLERRLGEHQTKYGKLKNVHINLTCFHVVDVKYTSEAENEIRDFFNTFGKSLDVEGYNELVTFTQREYKQITRQYKSIGERYTGNTAGFKLEINELNKKIQDLHDDIKDLRHTIELKDRELLANKRINELEIANRDMQITLLKNGLN